MISLCERDNWTCWICGGLVDIGWEEGSPSAPSRDHVIPRAHLKKMAQEVPDNIKLAHRYCNSERKTDAVINDSRYRRGLKKAQEKWDKK